MKGRDLLTKWPGNEITLLPSGSLFSAILESLGWPDAARQVDKMSMFGFSPAKRFAYSKLLDEKRRTLVCKSTG